MLLLCVRLLWLFDAGCHCWCVVCVVGVIVLLSPLVAVRGRLLRVVVCCVVLVGIVCCRVCVVGWLACHVYGCLCVVVVCVLVCCVRGGWLMFSCGVIVVDWGVPF